MAEASLDSLGVAREQDHGKQLEIATDVSTLEPEARQEKDPGNSVSLAHEKLLVEQVQELCNTGDLPRLRQLAARGLLTDESRKIAWPVLLGVSGSETITGNSEKPVAWRQLSRHKDEDQVKLDVDRSFVYYPNNESNKQLDRRKGELSDLITEVLRRNPFLCYFQGYHDICQVFLLVLGPDAAVSAVTRLSILRIRDFMLPSMNPALVHLKLLPLLVSAEDVNLAKHLSLTQPFFALAATLTLYAHEIQEYGDIARLFDSFLAREAVYPIYVFAQTVLLRKEELFEVPADEPEILYSMLCKMPKPLDLDRLLSLSNELYQRFPPRSLPGWWAISASSVLKSALNVDQLSTQSLDQGKLAFARQVLDLKRAELRKRAKAAMWKYRKPLGSIGLSVFIGVLSWYMRRNGYGVNFIGFEGHLSNLFRKIRL